MKKTVVLFVCIISVVLCNAQIFSVKNLTGTKWELVKDYDKHTTITIEFTDSEIIESHNDTYFNKISKFTRPYYLSDLEPSSFDKERVGKKTNGKYLVYFISKSNMMFYRKIVEITNNRLVLFKKKTNSVGGVEATFTYKRIK